jgi:hypothetical protein
LGVVEIFDYGRVVGWEFEDLIGMGLEEGAEALAVEVGLDFVAILRGDEEGMASLAGVGGDDDGARFFVEDLEHLSDEGGGDGGVVGWGDQNLGAVGWEGFKGAAD